MANLYCWQCCVVIFNIISAISGLVLFAAGSFLLYRLISYGQFIGANADGPVITLIFMGLLTSVVSYIFWRAIFNIRRPQILFYSIILFAIIITEFTCFVWSLVIWENLEVSLKMNMDNFFMEAIHDKDQYSIAKWDRIQIDLKCCGPGGPGDYRSAKIVPWSCCSSSSGPHSPDCGNVFQRGCINPVYEYARDQVMHVALAALGAVILQILGLFVTCCLLTSSGGARNRNPEISYHPPELASSLAAGETPFKS